MSDIKNHVMSGFVRAYQNFLKRYPFLLQSTQTGVLMGVGDLIAQTVGDRTDIKSINLTRTAEFAGMGFFLVAPGLTIWYGLLDRYVGKKGTTVVVKKVALDQLVVAPIFVGLFLSTLGVIQTRNLTQTVERVKRDYKDVLLANYKIWPVVQLVNFYFVPLQYQVLLVQCISLFWNSYLSWKTQTDISNMSKKTE